MDILCLLLKCQSMLLYKSRGPPCRVDMLTLMKYLLNVSCLSRESLISSFSSSIYPFSQVSSNLQSSADFLTFYKSHIQKERWGIALFFLLRDDGNPFVSCMKICHLQSLKGLTLTHFYLCISSCGALSICRGCTWLWYHGCLTQQAKCQGILWQSIGV